MIEKSIETLTAAVNRNSELLEKVLAKSGSASTATAAPKTEAKTETKKASAGKKSKVPTVDEVRTAFGDYLNKGGPAKERDSRIEEITSINDHFGIKSLQYLDAANTTEALGYLAQLKKGETLSFMNEEGEEESEGESPI